MSHTLVCSEVAASEFFTFQELLEVVPEHVLHIHVVVSLVSLEFKLVRVPLHNLWWDLAACEVHVVRSDTGEELSLLVAIFPIFELPVLSIDEDSNNPLPARISEVGYTVVDIEGDVLVANPFCDMHKLRTLGIHLHVCAWLAEVVVLLVESFFKETLHISEGQVPLSKHGGHDNHWV